MGYFQKVGNGRKVKSWKDLRFRYACLATQCWDLYVLAHEQNVTIDRVWDAHQLEITFGR